MKVSPTKKPNNVLISSLSIAGALFIYTTSFSLVHADGFNNGSFNKKRSCTLKCKPDDPKNPNGRETCVFVPIGCNNRNILDIPKSQLKQLTNPRLVNPKLINPKRKIIPGDQFLLGDQFKPNKLPK